MLSLARPKKDGKKMTVYMETSVLEAIDDYSAKTHIPKTAIVEEAVKLYLSQQNVDIPQPKTEN